MRRSLKHDPRFSSVAAAASLLLAALCMTGCKSGGSSASGGQTGAQVMAKSKAAYDSLTSYKGVSKVTGTGTAGGANMALNTHATIQFVRPGKIHVEGITMFGGSKFAYASDGVSTWENLLGQGWKPAQSTEMAVGGATGISMLAGMTIPGTLLKLAMPPFASGSKFSDNVASESVGGQPTYKVEATNPAGKTTCWVDKKSLLLVKVRSELKGLTADETFAEVEINPGIPETVFAKPAGVP